MKKIYILLLIVLFPISSFSHKFYTSIAQVEYNAQTKSAEVILNLFWDDMEVAISGLQKENISIGHPNFSIHLSNYLKNHFQLKDKKNQVKDFSFIGFEINSITMTVYFEIPAPEGLNALELTNRVLIREFKDQTNIVNFISDKGRKTMLFQSGKEVQKINL